MYRRFHIDGDLIFYFGEEIIICDLHPILNAGIVHEDVQITVLLLDPAVQFLAVLCRCKITDLCDHSGKILFRFFQYLSSSSADNDGITICYETPAQPKSDACRAACYQDLLI